MKSYYLRPDLYDLVYADYVADVPLHVAAAKAAAGPVLEACCGTGRLLVPLLEAGVDADGLDGEPAMLDHLRARLASRGLHATLHRADMRDFSLPRRYAQILIAFNSFLHNLTQGDQLRTLRCCRAHLAEGGTLRLALFHPSAVKLIELADVETITKDVPIAGTPYRLEVRDRTADDRVEQIRRLTRRIERKAVDGTVLESHDVTFDIRYVFKPEMELLLHVAGFTRWQVEPMFTDYREPASIAVGRPVREGDHLLWTAWKD